MGSQEISRSKILNNIPQKKLDEFLSNIEKSSDDIKTKNLKMIALNRYSDSNIPIEYWTKKMERDWAGDPNLLTFYNSYVEDIKESYISGKSVCLASSHGRR